MLNYSYQYTIAQYEALDLVVGYKIRGRHTGFKIMNKKGEVLAILKGRKELEELVVELIRMSK